MANSHSSSGAQDAYSDAGPSTAGWRARRAVVAAAALGAALTGALAVDPAGTPGARWHEVRIVLETSLVLVFALVAVLAWGRYRLRHHAVDLILVGVVIFTWVLQPAWNALGGALNGRSGSVLASVVARLAGGLTLAWAASWPYVRRARAAGPRHLPWWGAAGIAVAGATAAVSGLLAIAAVFGGAGVPTATDPLAGHFGRYPGFESLELLGAVTFFVAGWGFARHADTEKDPFVAWVALACVIDGLVGVNYALFPTLSTSWLYTGDAFRVAALGAWAGAGLHEIASYQAEMARLARAEERRRIARDLHDGLAQDLAYLSSRAKLLLSSTKADEASLSDIAATSERALQESRRAVLSLTRPTFVPLDVDLANTAREAARGYPTGVQVFVDRGVRVGPQRREALVYMVREAVHNAARHGCAERATVEVLASEGGMVLRVTDDGSGFDPTRPAHAAPGPQRSGFGLVSMEERSRAAGGRFALTSAPGRGTTIEVKWP